MNPRYLVAIVAAAVVALAVAAVLVGGNPLGGHRSAAYLDVSPVEGPAPAERTLAYGSLSPGQQRVFRDALDAEDGLVRIPPDVDESVWIDDRYVSYRDRTYHVAVAVS